MGFRGRDDSTTRAAIEKHHSSSSNISASLVTSGEPPIQFPNSFATAISNPGNNTSSRSTSLSPRRCGPTPRP